LDNREEVNRVSELIDEHVRKDSESHRALTKMKIGTGRTGVMSGLHEDYSRNHALKNSSARSFGLVFTTFFVLVGAVPVVRHSGGPRWWALVLAACILAVALLKSSWLVAPSRLWTKLGLLLNQVVSPVVMAVLFFGMFTPVAAILRLTGRDSLRLRRDPDAKSYWIDRVPAGPDPQGMANQF
jgi:hypothetical protein